MWNSYPFRQKTLIFRQKKSSANFVSLTNNLLWFGPEPSICPNSNNLKVPDEKKLSPILARLLINLGFYEKRSIRAGNDILVIVILVLLLYDQGLKCDYSVTA